MGQRAVLSMALCGLGAALLLPGTVQAQQDRVSVSEKGSLVIWPKVELRWDSNGQLIQNTILSLTNDRNAPVQFQAYYVQGDPYLEEVDGVDGGVADCIHLGWNKLDVAFQLTANQAIAWSLVNGQVFGGPQIANFRSLDNCNPPGRPDPENTNDRVLRGYVIGWAVNLDGEEIHHNHLKGEATIINYRDAAAWEYSTYNHQAIVGTQGQQLDEASGDLNDDTVGVLEIGTEYSPAYNTLLLNFVAVGSPAFTSGANMVGGVNTDLTLMPMDQDLRQGGEPVMTKATVTIWNSNEIKISELDQCIFCWDERLLSEYQVPNSFLVENLGTDFGKARFEDTASAVCDTGDIITIASPLVGVAVRQMNIDPAGAAPPGVAYAGTHLIGSGTANATIAYIANGDSEPLIDVTPETPAQVVEWVERQIRKGAVNR